MIQNYNMQVIDFFEGPLGLLTSEKSCNKGGGRRRIKVGVTRQDLKDIPVMMVGMEVLNDNMKEIRNDHFGSNQSMTRGLCLSEHDTIGSQNQDENIVDCVGVTAILCLSGLPADLTASILAHGTFIPSTLLVYNSRPKATSAFIHGTFFTLLHRKYRGNARLY